MTRAARYLLLLAGLHAASAPAALLDQAGLELRLDDNLARAELERDITGDVALAASAVGSAGYQLGDSDRLKLSVDLSATAYRRYVGLDMASLRLTASHRHKFGLGAYAPALSLSASVARQEFRDSARTGWHYELDAALSRRISPRLELQLGYGFQMRRADDEDPRVVPFIAANVFDTSSRHLRIRANALITPRYLVSAGYAIHKGDIISTTLRNLPIFLASDAIAADPTFGPERFAYTLTAMTHDVQLSISRLIDDTASMSLGYQFIDSRAEGGIRYRANLVRASYLRQF
ncbi:MAG: hypothetical protein KDG55_04895 [Rhodocyclaceae bacterium]|nr:hypothetical protein [Rhodocyclaceae bacterium]